MARNEQLIRQQKMLHVLEQSRFGRSEQDLRDLLLEELGLDSLSTRTVRRDLQALQFAGYDIDTAPTPQGPVWKAGPQLRNLPQVPVSATELLALSVGRDFLVPLAGTPFWQGIETLWSKIREALPSSVWRHFDRHRANLIFRGASNRMPERLRGLVTTFDRAIQQHRIVRIEYQGLGKTKPEPREVEPYRIVVYQGNIYVLAGLAGAGAEESLRQFKLTRVRRAVVLDRRFKARTDLDGDRVFGHSVGIFLTGQPVEFRIRFRAYVAPWVKETPFHPHQVVEEQEGGDLLVVIPSAHAGEIIPRVLALGENAEVLAPHACREELARIAAVLSRMYCNPMPAPLVSEG